MSTAADDGQTVAPLLSLLLGTADDTARLVAQLDQVSARTAATVPWFGEVRTLAGGEPAALAAVRRLVPAALAEAARIARRDEAARAAHLQRVARWREMEARRLAPHAVSAATRRTLGPLTAYGVAIVALALAGGHLVGEVGQAVFCLAVGLLCLVIQFWREIGLAHQVAGEYGRGYTLFSQAGEGFLRAGRGRGAGFGCLVIVLGPCVAYILVVFPAPLYVVLLIVHIRSVSRRRALWNSQYAAAHARVVNGR